jgi:hypothetical protein
MRITIVVSRYNENIDWTKQFSDVIIYNKGEKIPNTIRLPNVGKEGHTYYKHICDNYDNLADYTIFLQGFPFDHSPNVISNIKKYIDNPNLDIEFEYLSEMIINCNLTGCKYHSNLPLIDTYEKLFGERKNAMDFQFGAGAQFIVSKKCILKRPKSFYSKIVEMLQTSVNPIEGYVIERFHKIIFEHNQQTPMLRQMQKQTQTHQQTQPLKYRLFTKKMLFY